MRLVTPPRPPRTEVSTILFHDVQIALPFLFCCVSVIIITSIILNLFAPAASPAPKASTSGFVSILGLALEPRMA
jgi:hypothetical protein